MLTPPVDLDSSAALAGLREADSFSLDADFDSAPMASILPDLQATPFLIGQASSSPNPIAEMAMPTLPMDLDCSAETMCFFSYGRMSRTSLDYFSDEMINGPIDLLKEEITHFDYPFEAMYYQPMSVPRSSELDGGSSWLTLLSTTATDQLA